MSAEAFISVRIAAQRAGVAIVTVRRWLTEGRLTKCYRGPTRRVVVSVAELEAALAVRRSVDFAIDRD